MGTIVIKARTLIYVKERTRQIHHAKIPGFQGIRYVPTRSTVTAP
jgi:hypothetical protein